MRIFVSGGCKNGKSGHAEVFSVRLHQRELERDAASPLYYVATMIPSDSEDDARILRHQAERAGLGFQTIEAKRDLHLLPATQLDPRGTVLLDSVTALVLNEMLTPDYRLLPEGAAKVADNLAELAAAVKNIIFVSDYIYSDAYLYDEYTTTYRQGLALVDRRLASLCDAVCEVSFGNLAVHKGAGLMQGLSERSDQ